MDRSGLLHSVLLCLILSRVLVMEGVSLYSSWCRLLFVAWLSVDQPPAVGHARHSWQPIAT